jgi:hypothetical protein
VPFYGACIHVPPPPANQTVLVEAATGVTVQIRQAFDTVWVTGRLAAHRTDTGLAKAGYTLTATEVSPLRCAKALRLELHRGLLK